MLNKILMFIIENTIKPSITAHLVFPEWK